MALQQQFLTRPLCGIGTKSSFGHDERSIALDEVVLWHGGEAQASPDAYASFAEPESAALQKFLRSLVLFSPDNTASNLDSGDRKLKTSRSSGTAAMKLTVLLNDPTDPEEWNSCVNSWSYIEY